MGQAQLYDPTCRLPLLTLFLLGICLFYLAVLVCLFLQEPRPGGVEMVTPQQLEAKLREALKAEYVQATDLSDGCGAKFDLIVVSPAFEGKPLLARHRAVNGAIADELTRIHAITMKTLTPSQWQQQQSQPTPIQPKEEVASSS